ncbi:DUF2399 domain-containing protein [Streptomyces carpinensis]|uniref:DUF2399 domain-containing protein n=1 Tax=Streptomyces carpinensis TaxID=66369 RepID=A0ABV1VUI4_9ACTN|nr:DUF2399 domain-containing protein [Streptomyces carpinensis]
MPAHNRIHVCENPRVVEAAADAGRTAPLPSGSATTVVLRLLDALADTGCTFAYHGDFDWDDQGPPVRTRREQAARRASTLDRAVRTMSFLRTREGGRISAVRRRGRSRARPRRWCPGRVRRSRRPSTR